MPEADKKPTHYRCLKCAGEPDYVNQFIKEQHMGQMHQQHTSTKDSSGIHHDMYRQEDGYFRCPSCSIGCRIANKIRPHVNGCHGPKNSMSTEILDAWDYSIPPNHKDADYPVKGVRGAKRELNLPPVPKKQAQQPKPKAARAPAEAAPLAGERHKAFAKPKQADQAKAAPPTNDKAAVDKAATNDRDKSSAPKRTSTGLPSFSRKDKTAQPSGSASALVDRPPVAGPSRQLHEPVSAVASGSSRPAYAPSGIVAALGPARAKQQQHQQPQQRDAEDRRRPTGPNSTSVNHPLRDPAYDRQPSPQVPSHHSYINGHGPGPDAVSIQPPWLNPVQVHQPAVFVGSGLPTGFSKSASKAAPRQSILRRPPGSQSQQQQQQQQQPSQSDGAGSSSHKDPRFLALYGPPNRQLPGPDPLATRAAVHQLLIEMEQPSVPGAPQPTWPPTISSPEAPAGAFLPNNQPQQPRSDLGNGSVSSQSQHPVPQQYHPRPVPVPVPAPAEQQQSERPLTPSPPVQPEPSLVAMTANGSNANDDGEVAPSAQSQVVAAPVPPPYVKPTDPRAKRAREAEGDDRSAPQKRQDREVDHVAIPPFQ